jgi:hypothetical protein
MRPLTFTILSRNLKSRRKNQNLLARNLQNRSLPKEVNKMEISKCKIEGFSRVQITEDKNGKTVVVGDSGFVGPNQVVNLGFLHYLVRAMCSSAGSKYIGYVALGTGTAPGAAHTGLDGEIMLSSQRKAVTAESSSSTTAQFTATFASSDSFLSAAADISNIGLFYSTETTDTLFAGNTYASSSCDTNQNVNITYQIRFS